MNIKELLNIVKTELKDLSTLNNPDFRIEQVEYKKDEDYWEIVVSYLVDNTNPRNLLPGIVSSEFRYHRLYKRIKIDKEKKVVGMYIYEQ